VTFKERPALLDPPAFERKTFGGVGAKYGRRDSHTWGV